MSRKSENILPNGGDTFLEKEGSAVWHVICRDSCSPAFEACRVAA